MERKINIQTAKKREINHGDTRFINLGGDIELIHETDLLRELLPRVGFHVQPHLLQEARSLEHRSRRQTSHPSPLPPPLRQLRWRTLPDSLSLRSRKEGAAEAPICRAARESSCRSNDGGLRTVSRWGRRWREPVGNANRGDLKKEK